MALEATATRSSHLVPSPVTFSRSVFSVFAPLVYGVDSANPLNVRSLQHNHARDDAMGELASEYASSASAVSCATCFLTVDHLGSTRLVSDQSANLIAYHDYLPFGEEIMSGVDGRTGPWSESSDNINQKFTGKERDSESGLDYFGARYYGSALGRFMSPDWAAKAEPVPYAKLDNPQTLNLYAYVGNNPLARPDPDGHCAWDFCIVETAVAVGIAVEDGIAGAGAVAAAAGAGADDGNHGYCTAYGVCVHPVERNMSPPGSRPGKDFTKAGKKAIDQANADKNDGQNKCENCGKNVNKKANKKGEPTPDDQLQRQHKNPGRCYVRNVTRTSIVIGRSLLSHRLLSPRKINRDDEGEYSCTT